MIATLISKHVPGFGRSGEAAPCPDAFPEQTQSMQQLQIEGCTVYETAEEVYG